MSKTLKECRASDVNKVFLNTDEEASEATLQDSSKINGIFEDEGMLLDVAGVKIETTSPTFLCQTSDIIAKSIVNDTQLTIDGITYKVIQKLKTGGDGAFTALELSRD